MMNTILGIAPDSWGIWFPIDEQQVSWSRYLDEVAAAGYRWTELGPFGYLPTDPEQLGQELGSRGLGLCGATIGGELSNAGALHEIERRLFELMALLDHFEDANSIVVLPESYSDFHTGKQIMPKEAEPDQWQQMVTTVNRLAEHAAARGYQTLFHPHADSWIEREEQIARFLDDTDSGRIGLCFDTGHHAYSGGDAVAFFRRYHARIPYLHLKSVDSEILAGARREGLAFAQAVARDVMCEPAEGIVDFKALREALRAVNFKGFAIVEQDMYPTAPDRPFPIAQRTFSYLTELGF